MPADEEGNKWACSPCIRGHRSTKCQHWDRVMVKVKKPGRPLSTCPHTGNGCTCNTVAMMMTRVMKGSQCICAPDPHSMYNLTHAPGAVPNLQLTQPFVSNFGEGPSNSQAVAGPSNLSLPFMPDLMETSMDGLMISPSADINQTLAPKLEEALITTPITTIPTESTMPTRPCHTTMTNPMEGSSGCQTGVVPTDSSNSFMSAPMTIHFGTNVWPQMNGVPNDNTFSSFLFEAPSCVGAAGGCLCGDKCQCPGCVDHAIPLDGGWNAAHWPSM